MKIRGAYQSVFEASSPHTPLIQFKGKISPKQVLFGNIIRPFSGLIEISRIHRGPCFICVYTVLYILVLCGVYIFAGQDVLQWHKHRSSTGVAKPSRFTFLQSNWSTKVKVINLFNRKFCSQKCYLQTIGGLAVNTERLHWLSCFYSEYCVNKILPNPPLPQVFVVWCILF